MVTKVGSSMPRLTISLSSATTHVPSILKEQLKSREGLIIPVGSPYVVQELLVLEKDEKIIFSTRNVLPAFFVPLTHE